MNRLDKIRDEMAAEHSDTCYRLRKNDGSRQFVGIYSRHDYALGFDDAIGQLMPEVEKLVAAAQSAAQVGDIKFKANVFSAQVSKQLESALANWHNFIGDKTKGEG